METRFKMLTKSNPDEAKFLWHEAQQDAETRFHLYEYLAQRKNGKEPAKAPQQTETLQATSQEKSKAAVATLLATSPASQEKL
jgi:hypothetical protein